MLPEESTTPRCVVTASSRAYSSPGRGIKPRSVDAQDRKRHLTGDVVERGQHPFAGLVAHAAVLRPTGGDVGDASVQACSPAASPPSWDTRSISTNPGLASSQSAQVRTGIWLLSSEPNLVRLRPLSSCLRRSGARPVFRTVIGLARVRC